MFDLDLVFKVIRIIEILTLGTFEGGKNFSLGLEDFNMSVDTAIEDLPTYFNQISLTSVKVTASIDIFSENQWVFTWIGI